jgi:hypothetical protein
MLLTLVSFANVRLLIGIWNRPLSSTPQEAQYQYKLRVCAAVYVMACFVRAVWPRIDVERICFFDSILSVTFVGRSLATVAEMCLAWQLALVGFDNPACPTDAARHTNPADSANPTDPGDPMSPINTINPTHRSWASSRLTSESRKSGG